MSFQIGGDFRSGGFGQLPAPPFNETIRICQAMYWWQDALYLGGGRGPVNQRGARAEGPADMGAQIMRLGPDEAWAQVYDSPVDGAGVARDRSIRAFAGFKGKGDSAEALYAAAGSMSEQVQLLRSVDGQSFEDCGPPGLGQGDTDIAAVRCLFELDGWLYTTPVGLNKSRGWADDNIAALPVVLRTQDPASGDWQAISPPAFDDPANDSLNELIAFNGTIYAATHNRAHGFQLWRAENLDSDAPTWVKVLDRGACRGMTNPMPTAMIEFDGALYIGTGVQRQPGKGSDFYGPFAAELIRVNADDSWDLIAGETRVTPDGLKQPISGLGAGFGDPFVQAFWRLAAHDGKLYVGGSDWRYWPTYLGRGRRQRHDITDLHLGWLREMTEEWQGDYSIWSSSDGTNFQALTHAGLGDNPTAYGLRQLLSTPAGLIAVPAARQAGDGGGIQVWLRPETEGAA